MTQKMNLIDYISKRVLRSDTWKIFTTVVITAAWCGFQFSLGHRLYAVVLAVIFVVVIIFKKIPFFALALFVFALILVKTSVFKGWTELREENIAFFEHPKEEMVISFTPGEGKEVYVEEAKRIYEMVEESGLTDYRFSGMISTNIETMRIVEITWPMRVNESSPFVFCLVEELPSYAHCTLVDSGEEVALVRCD